MNQNAKEPNLVKSSVTGKISIGESRYWRGHSVTALNLPAKDRVTVICEYLCKFGDELVRDITVDEFLALDPPPRIKMTDGLDMLSDDIFERTGKRYSRDQLWNYSPTGELAWVMCAVIDLYEAKHAEDVSDDTFPA